MNRAFPRRFIVRVRVGGTPSSSRPQSLGLKRARRTVFTRVQDATAYSKDLAPRVGVVNLDPPVGVVNLASPVGVVNLALPVGVVNLASPVGVVNLAHQLVW